MNERTKLGLEVLEAALLLGLLGDALLRATPWGLNVFLWTGALATASIMLLARWRCVALTGEGRWLVLPTIFFALAFAWRDSPVLEFLDALALLVTLSLIALRARTGRIRLAGLVEYGLGTILASFDALFGSFALLLRDIRWKDIPHRGWSRHAMGVARGLLIAIPLLLVFGALFMAADAVFEGIINSTLHLDFGQLLTHVLLVLFIAWVVGGFLRGTLVGNKIILAGQGYPPSPSLSGQATDAVAKPDASENKSGDTPRPPAPVSLGVTEIGVALGLLDALFLCFVVIQIRYFFGGAALVQTATGLTYAEYARRGFFELVTVATLSLPLLLAAHWLLRKENHVHERVFRALAGGQILLLFVIMTSAIARMRLYQSEYGLTELRLYTTAFMCWLALVFIWFAATVLRGRRERFTCGALVAGFLIIAALHQINPDAFIVRANMAHARAGRGFDAGYAASLSADAVPALVESLAAMNRYDRCKVAARIIERHSTERPDWRTWNWSRAEARSVRQENAEKLRGMACPQNARGANNSTDQAVADSATPSTRY